MSNDNSEPAFPIQASEYGGHGTCFGMSLRDYFAAKALQGVLANDNLLDLLGKDCESQADLQLKLANAAYSQADAMIAARSQS